MISSVNKISLNCVFFNTASHHFLKTCVEHNHSNYDNQRLFFLSLFLKISTACLTDALTSTTCIRLRRLAMLTWSFRGYLMQRIDMPGRSAQWLWSYSVWSWDLKYLTWTMLLFVWGLVYIQVNISFSFIYCPIVLVKGECPIYISIIMQNAKFRKCVHVFYYSLTDTITYLNIAVWFLKPLCNEMGHCHLLGAYINLPLFSQGGKQQRITWLEKGHISAY